MDVLDFNLHQLILRDIAGTVESSEDDDSTNRAMDLLTSRVKTRDLSNANGLTQERVFMVREERLGLFMTYLTFVCLL